jgi:hypothetical protein
MNGLSIEQRRDVLEVARRCVGISWHRRYDGDADFLRYVAIAALGDSGRELVADARWLFDHLQGVRSPDVGDVVGFSCCCCEPANSRVMLYAGNGSVIGVVRETGVVTSQPIDTIVATRHAPFAWSPSLSRCLELRASWHTSRSGLDRNRALVLAPDDSNPRRR